MLCFKVVQLKNIYSRLNSSLKLSDSVHDLSCQQSYCNSMTLHKCITIIHFTGHKFLRSMRRLTPNKQEGHVALYRSPEFCLKLTYRYLLKADHVPRDTFLAPEA